MWRPMQILQRMTAMLLAAVMTVSPALACSNFCADRAVGGQPETAHASAAEHTHCAESAAVPVALTDPGDADCDGMLDCAGTSLKAPALAAVAAVSVSPPVIVSLGPSPIIAGAALHSVRQHVRPPTSGPPKALTPVVLGTLLRV